MKAKPQMVCFHFCCASLALPQITNMRLLEVLGNRACTCGKMCQIGLVSSDSVHACRKC